MCGSIVGIITGRARGCTDIPTVSIVKECEVRNLFGIGLKILEIRKNNRNVQRIEQDRRCPCRRVVVAADSSDSHLIGGARGQIGERNGSVR